jgi:transposase
MTLGRAPTHEDLFRSTREVCESRLPERSIFRLLAAKAHELFPDDAFADLYAASGRPSISPRIVCVVMVLQRYSGMSDREAVDAFTFDARWKYAAGALDFDFPGFVHTVLVSMRERLRRSEHPNRIFEAVIGAAREAGLIGRKRVLDSTALYDAVATQDTVTLVRSALVGLLAIVDRELEAEMRSGFERDDDYRKPGKPSCDWDDAKAREALVDALALDGGAALAVLHGRSLDPRVRQAAELLATVLGQDLDQGDDGVFRIARRVAEGRVISTVDPEARHGHKTAARGFDGYKGHISIDPDSELIVTTDVTPGNVGDAAPAAAMLDEVLATAKSSRVDEPIEIYGDSSYGTADLVEHIEGAGAEANVKVQPPSAAKGHFAQDAFTIDLDAKTVCCPNGQLVRLRLQKDGAGTADFGVACRACPLRAQCTDSASGRTVRTHPKHKTLARTRASQRDPAWKQRYRAVRPKVERKIGHLMRRKHGGRRARVRGRTRVAHDFALLAAAVNLARIAVLRMHLVDLV